MIWESFESYAALSRRAADILFDAIRDNPRIVLGLPTGNSPIGMYERVVQECARHTPCFREVTAFNLDEYVGVGADHPGSYCTYMKQHLYEHVDIDPRCIHIPDGMAADLDAECARYETEILRAGGIDLMFLGLGRNGHIGFNEPGTPSASRTRVVKLTASTRAANAPFFRGGIVPESAITMGIGTILDSEAIVLIASGSGKADAVARLRAGALDEQFPASALWLHPNVRVLVGQV